jgi:hypothetical protein
MVLSWDLFTAHCDKVVSKRASILSIRFVFVPSRITGQCEPFNKRMFGSMKHRVACWPEEAIACPGDADCTIEAPVATSLGFWNIITRGEVNGSWDQFRWVNEICAEVLTTEGASKVLRTCFHRKLNNRSEKPERNEGAGQDEDWHAFERQTNSIRDVPGQGK